MGIIKVEEKIDWAEVARRVSKIYGKTVHRAYCRDTYNGHHTSPRLLKLIQDVINQARQEVQK